jgi:hypothetical protein
MIEAASTGLSAGRLVAEVGFTDGFGFDDLFWFAAGIGAVIGTLRLMLGPLIRRLDEEKEAREHDRAESAAFRRIWYGEDAEPGRDAIPGMPERINRIDGELQRNGGSTLKDAAFETKRLLSEEVLPKVTALGDDVVAINQRLDYGDHLRRGILAATAENMHATRDAFLKAGLEPPEYTPIPVIIEPPHEPY